MTTRSADPPVRNAATASHDGRPPGLAWDYDRGEVWVDGAIHALGLALGLVGAVVLVGWTAAVRGPVETAAVVIYATGLLAMLGCSAAYNLWPISRTKWWLRRFDHAAIYVMIAGTYTPFMTQLKDGRVAWGFFVGVWTVAIAGTVAKIALPGRGDRLSLLVYLALSWSGVMAYEAVLGVLPPTTLWLLAAGGLFYTGGVAFHLWQSLRFQNAIWHGFVLVAAALHYGAVLDCMVLAKG